MNQLDLICQAAIESSRPVALDSSALIALLTDELPFGPIIAKLPSSRVPMVLSAIVISESLVRMARYVERSDLESIAESIQAEPAFRVVSFGADQIVETAIVRVETRLKFPDASIIATARVAGAIAIVGNDRAWQNKPLGIRYIHLDDVAREQQPEDPS